MNQNACRVCQKKLVRVLAVVAFGENGERLEGLACSEACAAKIGEGVRRNREARQDRQKLN